MRLWPRWWRWPWQRRALSVDSADEARCRRIAAAEAEAYAEQALREARARWPEVNERSEVMRQIRHENHLAELVRRNIRGRHA